jgi:hypothetical protein
MALDHMHAHQRRIAADLGNEWHQSGPHTDQTERHSGNSNISAHRFCLRSSNRMAIARAPRGDADNKLC